MCRRIGEYISLELFYFLFLFVWKLTFESHEYNDCAAILCLAVFLSDVIGWHMWQKYQTY